MKFFRENTTYLHLVFLAISFIWLRSAFGKFSDGKFVSGLSGTLSRFAANNPYPFYKDFLNSVAIPNSYIFAILTMWGELFAGASIGIIALFLILKKNLPKFLLIILSLGFLTGAFLNTTFWLASGYMSPSTDGLNLLMFLVEVVGFLYTFLQLKRD